MPSWRYGLTDALRDRPRLVSKWSRPAHSPSVSSTQQAHARGPFPFLGGVGAPRMEWARQAALLAPWRMPMMALAVPYRSPAKLRMCSSRVTDTRNPSSRRRSKIGRTATT